VLRRKVLRRARATLFPRHTLLYAPTALTSGAVQRNSLCPASGGVPIYRCGRWRCHGCGRRHRESKTKVQISDKYSSFPNIGAGCELP
jgi:hypothetical protein